MDKRRESAAEIGLVRRPPAIDKACDRSIAQHKPTIGLRGRGCGGRSDGPRAVEQAPRSFEGIRDGAVQARRPPARCGRKDVALRRPEQIITPVEDANMWSFELVVDPARIDQRARRDKIARPDTVLVQ